MRFVFPWQKRVNAKRTIWEEILKRIFLYKNEVHFGKREPSVDGLGEVVHFFFLKLLKMPENYTLEEVPEALERHGYKKAVTSRVEAFINQLSTIKYARHTIDKKELYELVHSFETIIYLLNREQVEKEEHHKPKRIFTPPAPQLVMPPMEDPSVSYGSVTVAVQEGAAPDATPPPQPIARPPKVSLRAIEFNSIFERGKSALAEEKADEARKAYEELSAIFERLSKTDKQDLHSRLIELYEDIVRTG